MAFRATLDLPDPVMKHFVLDVSDHVSWISGFVRIQFGTSVMILNG